MFRSYTRLSSDTLYQRKGILSVNLTLKDSLHPSLLLSLTTFKTMGSGNSTIRPDYYESKSLKEMKSDWVNTVKSVYKFGLLKDIQIAYDNINIYKGEYIFCFDPDTPMYTFDYVHEVLENKNLDLETVVKWFSDNNVQITPRTLISAVRGGNMDAVKHFCKDGTMNPLSNNFYPVVYYDGHDGIMNTKLLYQLKDIESGKLKGIPLEENCCSVSPKKKETEEEFEKSWEQYHHDRMDKETMFKYVSKFWKICVGPILIQTSIEEGHLEILKWLISEGITDTRKVLNFKSIHENKDLLDFLLDNGYEITKDVLITAMGTKDVEYLDGLIKENYPVDISIEYVPGEYNMHTFFGGSYINVLSGLVCSNPDHRVFEWAINHGFKFPDGTVYINNLIIEERVDILEYLFEHRPDDIQIASRKGDLGYIIKAHPELMMKVLNSGVNCDNYMRTAIFKYGDADFMDFMKKGNFMEDTKRVRDDDYGFHHSYIFDDSLEHGNTVVSQWALDNGYKPDNRGLSASILIDSYEGTKWALEKGLSFFSKKYRRHNKTTVKYICQSYEIFELFRDIVDFKEYGDIFDYEKCGMFESIDERVIKELEKLDIVVTLPYESVSSDTLDWDFVREWKKCKTWDQERFMDVAMKYRDGKVPEELQEILDEI